MLKKFDMEPGTRIIVATVLILVLSGARVFNQWDSLSFWREPGLIAAIALGLISAIALAVTFVIRRRPLQDVDYDGVHEGPVIDLQAESKPERAH
ncbi:hypothetical protein QA648_35055 (plasmid) [Rhizobium sp. CB3171]|uniref:hypothetical protein n=1 Tax=Rhizobium sp. CB3171 TaxID=3039157 RepID=UPI0024B23C3D|nr:hypothetical protein [Rhizobium sp. CB3171]WFU07127.1 hypothetical protein QA648_35055 [Rhizobium sp. CB3171]